MLFYRDRSTLLGKGLSNNLPYEVRAIMSSPILVTVIQTKQLNMSNV